MNWNDELNQRLARFIKKHPSEYESEPISIKVRAEGGCFHKSCCPYALNLIYNKNEELDGEKYEYIEHESGPEIIAYIGLATSGVLIAKSIIELITTIIKARFEGQKQGDGHKGNPVTLIIRKTQKGKEVIEEKIMTFHEHDMVSSEIVEKLLVDGYKKLKVTEGKTTSQENARKGE